MRMIKSGSRKITRVVVLTLVLCLAQACVKREPRTEAKEDKPETSVREQKCGALCRMQKRNEQAEKERQSRSKTKEDKSREKRDTRRSGKGVYHTVKKGETFWRICHTYGVDQKTVARANGINDVTKIEVGQKIWIPGVDRTVVVTPAPPGTNAGKSSNTGTSKPPSAVKGTFILPVKGGKITSKFGMRGERMHEGIDISAPEGTPVLAADDGKVVHSDNTIRGYGNMIIIKHAGNLSTVYAHNKKNIVEPGDFVKRGQKIAEVGSTGRVEGFILHFEVRLGDKPVNPEYYLP